MGTKKVNLNSYCFVAELVVTKQTYLELLISTKTEKEIIQGRNYCVNFDYAVLLQPNTFFFTMKK